MAVARRLTLASAPVHILISRRHRGEHFGTCVMRCFAYAVFATRSALRVKRSGGGRRRRKRRRRGSGTESLWRLISVTQQSLLHMCEIVSEEHQQGRVVTSSAAACSISTEPQINLRLLLMSPITASCDFPLLFYYPANYRYHHYYHFSITVHYPRPDRRRFDALNGGYFLYVS